MTVIRSRRVLVVVYLAAVVLFPVAPLSLHTQPLVYALLGLVALVAAWVAVVRHSTLRRTSWHVLVAGFTAWWLGDLCYGLLGGVDRPGSRPGVSNVCYFLGYGLVSGGVVRMAARQRQEVNRVWILDAVMVCVGLAVPLCTVLSMPSVVAEMSSRLVLSVYLVADLFVVALLIRVLCLEGPGRPTRMLTGAVATALVSDASFQYFEISGHPTLSRWVAEGWLIGYVLIGLGAWSAADQVPRSPARQQAVAIRSLVVVAAVSVLPGVTLAVQGLRGDEIAWQPISIGVAALAMLMLARMAHLLRLLGSQSDRLRDLARRDGLTGLPNRRTWDHELDRACTSGSPFVVAVMDIDHFKSFNDRHGHQAGDHLLREAAQSWRRTLSSRHFLARYGGEEFALLLRGVDVTQAVGEVDRLRLVTPQEQSFSAGVVAWRPGMAGEEVFAEADSVLMTAKGEGRNRVVAGETAAPGNCASTSPQPPASEQALHR